MATLIDSKQSDMILQILKRGNTVELKREQGRLVIVEIRRQVKEKAPIIG